ncbi:unnamed protein product, partial [Mesorhabditis belari]|uniref:Uncharacterized protein n=1 Tax=Mesorhabditis belari TaxID=2138241 RepID=A0AAF3FD89_9BILA
MRRMRVFHFSLFCLLLYAIPINTAQRSSLLHPEHPHVNSVAYLNSSSIEAFQIINSLSSCQFHSGPVPCECFPIEGDYGLVQNESTLLTFTVGPPSISIIVPKSPIALLTAISIEVKPRLCLQQTHQVQLWHRSIEVLPESEDPWTKIDERAIALKDSPEKLNFECEIISRTGLYRVDVVGPMNVTVTTKEQIFVNHSKEALLELKFGSIFPHCSDEYHVKWTNPSCVKSNLQFRLRLLAVPEGNPDHLEERAIYVEEIGLDPGDSSLSLPCSQFDILYEQYCFELISLEPQSEQFHQWDVKCVHTEPVETVHGGWTLWSSWSKCEGKCEKGVRMRVRSCESPRPKRGKTCLGDVMQREICPLPDCPDVDFLIKDATNCTCGCVLEAERGTFYATKPAKECKGNLTWEIASKKDQLIDLIFVKEGQPHGTLHLHQKGTNEKLLWSSGKSFETSLTKRLDSNLFFRYVNDESKERNDIEENANLLRPGFTVIYAKRSEVLPLALEHEPCQPFCSQHLIIGGVCLVLLTLILIPPFVCASITRRIKRNETPTLPLIDKRPNSEMIRSGNTDLTQVSAPKFVAKRSIGIQLSAHGTPRTGRATADTPLPFGSSSASVLDELEYDDYDGTRDPGSLLAPPLVEPYSTIDIEQIIAEARKIVDHVDKSDAHTQVGKL